MMRLLAALLCLIVHSQACLAQVELPLWQRMLVQDQLIALDLLEGTSDGQLGPKSRAAIAAFQSSIGEEANGVLGAAQLGRLLADVPLRHFTLLDNIDLPEGDYRSIKKTSLSACQAQCAGEGQCQAFTYNSRARVCFLKSSVEGRATFSGAISGTRTGVIQVGAPEAPTGFELLQDTDLPGYDYTSSISSEWLDGSSVETCQAACARDRMCKAFTYNSKAKVCFLKELAGTAERFRGAISGRRITMPQSFDGWETDPDALLVWARETIDSYRSPGVPAPRFGRIEMLAAPSALGFDQGLEPVDLGRWQAKLIYEDVDNWDVRLFPYRKERVYVSEEHRRLVRLLPQWDYQRDQDAEYARYFRGEGALADIAAQFDDAETAEGMLAALVRVDLASLQRVEATRDKRSIEPSDRVLREAITSLSRPMAGNDRLRRSIYRLLGTHARVGATDCMPDSSLPATPSPTARDAFLRAAAFYYQAGETLDLALMALTSARECSEGQDAIALAELSVDLAGSGTPRELAKALLDLALMYPVGSTEQHDLLAATFSVENGTAITEGEFLTASGFYNFTQLEAAGLTAEVDMALARLIASSLEDGIIASRAAQGSYRAIAETIESLERYDVADKFYARFTFPTTSPTAHPADYLIMLAENAIGEGKFELARDYMVRALGKTREGVADRTRVSLLNTLAEAQERLGGFSEASESSREALLLLRKINDGNLVAEEQELTARIERTAVTTVDPEHAIRRKLAEFDRTMEDGCGITKSGALTVVPDEFLVGDLEPPLFYETSASRFVGCIEGNFDRFERFVANTDDYLDQDAIEDYFQILAHQGEQQRIRTGFARLLLAGPAKILKPKDELRFARQRYLEKLVASVTGILKGGDRQLAAELVGDIWSAIDGPIWAGLIESSYSYGETPANYVQMLGVLGRKAEFMERAALLKDPLQASMSGTCFGPECEVLIEYRSAKGDRQKLPELYKALEVGMIFALAGASADSREIDRIRLAALASGTRMSQWGQFEAALAYFKAAGATREMALADKAPLASLNSLDAYVGLAETYRASGHAKDAYAISRHLAEAARDMVAESSVFADDALLRWASQLRVTFSTFLLTLPVGDAGEVAADDADLALFALQFMQTSATSATFTKLASRMGAKGSEAVREYQDLQPHLAASYAELAASKSASLSAQIERLEERRSAVVKLIEANTPRYFEYGRLQFAPADDLTAALRLDEAVLAAVPIEDSVLLAILTGGKSKIVRIDGIDSAALARDISAYRAAMKSGPELPSVPVGIGYSLYQRLLAPLEQELKHTRHLVVALSGFLESLPLSALVTTDPGMTVMGAGQLVETPPEWLIRRYDISIVPSLSALLILRREVGTSNATREFFGVGNPAYDTGGPLSLAALPESAAEVQYIGAVMGAEPERDLLLADAATKRNIVAAPLSDYRILDFATHGFVAGGVPGLQEPALALASSGASGPADAFLTSGDVAGLRLDADLVILSACSTAGSDGSLGADGLSGFASAFFYAGARNLVVTHWSIPSAPAIELSTGMIERKLEDPTLTWSAALQQAALSMIDAPESPLEAHPVSWAGHFVVGAS